MIKTNWKKMITCGSSIDFYYYSISKVKTSYVRGNTSKESNNLYCKKSNSKRYYNTNNHKIKCEYDQN